MMVRNYPLMEFLSVYVNKINNIEAGWEQDQSFGAI